MIKKKLLKCKVFWMEYIYLDHRLMEKLLGLECVKLVVMDN